MIAASLTTDRLTLRQPRASDLPVYTAYCASPRSHFVRGPFSAAQAFDKFAAIVGHWTLRGFGRYIMTLGDTPIGHVGPTLSDEAQPPEFTWTLWDGAHEGHGYATEAARAVQQHLLTDKGWPAMIIRVMPDNRGSVRIAERLGATRSDTPAPAWYPGCLTYHLTAQVPA